LLYHLKAAAKAFSTSTFKENIGITTGPDEDWRWSIVEAKGIRPQETPLPPEWLTPIPAPALDLPSPALPSVAPPIAQQQGTTPNSSTLRSAEKSNSDKLTSEMPRQ
jgi:hypothetical protein